MKNTKRGLSLFLAFALLFTSVGIGIETASLKTSVPKAESLSSADVSFACTFYVPELIYLTPSISANTATTFRYYVDCNTSGTLDTQNAKTSGTVYFYCANASAVSISCSGASVTLGSSSGSNTINTSVTAGTLSSGLSQGYTSTITWTATYTVNGENKTAKAYTVCYAPQVTPVAAVCRTFNDDGTGDYNADFQGWAYICGVHGCGTGGNYQANSSGSYILNPMQGTVTSSGSDVGASSWFFGLTNGWSKYIDRQGGGDSIIVQAVSPLGTLTVDTSRYSYINQIPNLKCGFAMTHMGSMNDNYIRYASNFSNTVAGWHYGDVNENDNNGLQNAIVRDTELGTFIFGYSNASGQALNRGVYYGTGYGGEMWDQAISTYDIIRLKWAGWARNSSGGEFNGLSCVVQVGLTKVDKSTLRSKVRQYTNMGLQSSDYSNYAAFESALSNAASRLGNPTSTDNSYSALDTAYNNLSRVAYSANIYHRSADGYVYQDEALTFYSGQTVSFGPNSYTGYTISSASGSTTSTSPQTWYNRRANITVTYTYTPNTNTVYKVNHYKVNVAQNGWDFAEQDTLYGTTNTTVTAPIKTYPGFYVNEEGLTVHTGVVAPDGSLVLIRYYRRNFYNITFNANGGSGGAGPTSMIYGGTLTAPSPGTRTGYTFSNWSPSVPSTVGIGDATYTAQWTANTYTVAYNGNGATGGSTASSAHTYDVAKALTANGFSRTGYTFTGWNTAANGSGTSYSNGQSVTNLTATQGATVTLYAQWTINQYTIYFDEAGGSTVSDITQNYGTTVTPPANPTRTGYTFTGWSPAVPGTMPANNTTCVAQWTINQYTIYFDEAGGSAVSDITQNYGTTVTPPANPTRTGYTFTGWSPAVPGTMPANNTTCVAQWSANTYQVTFNANTGTGSMTPQDIVFNTTEALSSNSFTKTGYTFTGWNTAANGSGTAYANGANFTMNVTGATLYAQWTANTYTVDYLGNGSTGGSTGDSSHTYDVAKNLTANGYTRTGHSFLGWSTSSSATTPTYTDGQSVTNLTSTPGGIVTFYAVWSVNSYTITFDANGGTGGWSESRQYGSALTAPTVTRTGYTFTSWSPAVPSTVPAANSTYTAQWTANTYTVTYNGNGSTGGSTANSAHTYDVAKALTTNGYTRTGYTFAGWATSAGGAVAYTDGQSVTNLSSTQGATVTLYAKWTANTYTVAYNGNGNTGGSTANSAHTYDVAKALTTNGFTKTGYTFAGWATTAGGAVVYTNGQSVTNLTATNGATVTLYAKWTANTYTVTFDAQGGSVSPASTVVTYDSTYGAGTGGWPSPARTGYTFGGWYTGTGGGGTLIESGTTVAITANQTLYAKWTAHTYTVAYDGNGNTGGSTASSSHTYDAAKNLTANGFTKTGYTFAGWNTAANGSGTSYTNSQSVTNLTAADGATVTLYAQWTINQYTIYFDEAGGSTVSDITQNYGTTVTPPANPTRTGYTFTGWSPAVPGTMPANNVTCVAQWTINQYTIYFDEAGGSAVSDITQNYGTTVTPPANPTRTGYTFTGWSPAVPGTIPANNTTCVAQWSANTYQVTFNANTGSGSMTAQDIVFNTTEALSSNSFTKTGYTFTGWNTAANGSGTAYANGANFTMNVTGATLYAQWTANTYTVVYNGNGSTGGTTANSSHTYDTAKNLTTNGYTKTGYTFAGWATSAGGAVAYSDGQSVTNLSSGQGATVTLYAKWTANTYTVAYDGNGNTSGSTADSPHTYDTAKNLTSNGYVKTGYTFTGWNTAANGSGTSYTNGQSVTNLTSTNGATVTLYAQWTANTYTVDYLGNGSTGGTTADSPHTYDLASNLTTNGYTRTGHSFLGWSTSSSATTADYADGQSVTNLTAAPGGVVTFYAVWSANTYQVTFNANGGSGSMAAQNIVYGQSAALTSNGYTKTGHTFTGWATSQANADAGTVAYANGGNFTMNTTGATIYAVWSINSYTITFNANGGTGGWSESRVYNSALTAPAVTRTGYTFTSWSPAVPATVPAANSTYTAQWTANTYTVTYNGNGADGGSTANSSHTYDAAKNLTANGYTKTGYTFAGWNTAADGSGTAYTNSQSVTNLTSVNGATVTLYARWTANTYTVAYDGNGSTGGSTADSAHTYDTAKNLTANGYSKTGYTFAGWNTGANGSGTSYTNGQSVTNLSAVNGATVTLYAQWTANTYTVTYDGNGATGGSTANSSHTYDTAKNLTANGYTKTGHSFEGWAMSSGGAAVYTDAQSVTNLTAVNGATVTLYAVWEPLPADYSAVTAAIALAQAATLPANAANDPEYIPGGGLYEAAEFTNGGWYLRSNFTAASLTAMDNAINAVVYGLNSTQQATVDGYAAAIMAAYNNIALDIADYSTLDDLVDEAEAILNDPNPPFTTESLDNLSMNLGYGYDTQAAQYKEPLQEWVDGIATMLSDAIAALVYKPADYTIVNNAWASRPDNLYEYYTAASVDNLVNYYNQQIDWNLTLENNGQATVNGYAAQIYALIAALVLKPADYTIVDNAIKAIPDNDGGLIGIDYDYLATIYTTASIADLTEAVEAVVTGKDISEQGIVDGYAADILDAISGLTPLAADYTFLGLALQNTPPWPGSYYTTATYTDYNDAVVAGQALYNNQNLNITQQQIVDDATADINAAYAALVLKPVTYTVRYTDALGAELSSDVQRDATAADTVTENAISITGYTPRQASIQKQMTGTSSENIFTFVYDINSYTITFNSNGGSAVTAITQNYNTQVQQPADPAKEGNDFAGWYTDAGLTNAVAWPVTLGASNATYYAKWVIKSYTITFDAQGGTVTPESISVNYGGNYGTLPVPEQEGYTFNGWYTQALGGALVENNQAFSANAAQTLYARWTMIPADVEDLEEAVEVNYSPDYVGSLPVTSGDGTVESTVYAYGSAAQRQAVEDAYTAAAALQAESPMPDTAANRGRIAAATEALNDALETLLLYPNPAVYTYVDEEIDEANRINLNRYTIASIDELQTAVDAVVTGKGAIDQAAVNAYAAGMYNHRAGASALVPYTDAKAPKLDVFETTEAMQAGGVTVSGFDPEDFGDVSYVYPGKAYYTYYCYTNSETPAILVNIADTADGNGRISYPTEMAVSSVSGTVNAGWMNYTYDGGTRAGTVTQSSMTVNDTRYADYTVGMNYDTLGEEYYKQAGCLVLKPEFVRSGGKQFAKYTISGTDDAGENANAADTTSLAGGTAAWQAGKPITTTNANVTPAGTITIYVEYRNSMSYEDGTYYDDGRAANSIRAYNNLGAEGTWVNKDYFYRVSGGATNDEIIKRNDTVYNANDTTYGQENLGCFYYVLDSERDAAVIGAYGDGSGAAAATAMMKQAIQTDAGGVYSSNTVAWPNTSWSLGHYIKSPSRLVYVHLADRWGNVFNKVIKINNVDPVNPLASYVSDGAAVVNEAGGSGITLVRVYEYAYSGSPSFVVPCWSDKLIEEINVINEPDNVLEIQLDNSATSRFTLYAADKAGGAVTRTVYTDAAGNLAVTINDPENMGGPGGNAGAKAMAGQAYTFLLNDSITVNLNTGGEAASYDITFKAGNHGTIGGAAETTVTLNENAPIEAPAVTADAGWVFMGWSPELPLSATESGAYTAQYAKTEIGLTKLESGMKVFIKGWREDYRYQIWSWQEVTSDALLDGASNVTANQWVLSKAYTPGSEGTLEADGSISYTIGSFTPPETNYTVSVRVLDENGNFVTELRDSYTPAEIGEAKITKVLVDGEYADGTVTKALESETVTIKIVGNLEGLNYTAAVVNPETALTGNGNEFTWDISALSPGEYSVKVTASNGTTSDTRYAAIRLYSTDGSGYGSIDELAVTQNAGTVGLTPSFSNGEFRYIVREPGREPLYTSESYGSVSAPLTMAAPGYGVYHVYGLVGGTGLTDYEDGIIRTLNIRRGAGKASVTLEANLNLKEGIQKGTEIVFTANAAIPGASGIEYSFWRHDARGYALVKDWSADNTLDWTPALIGGYAIEVRAKGADAGSYEAAKSVTVNVTDTAEEKAKGVVITLNEAELNAEGKARLPVTIKANATSENTDELLYKFLINDDDMMTVTLRNYSADQNCVWVPREAGTYKISVLVKSKASFGRYDAIDSFTVTVE